MMSVSKVVEVTLAKLGLKEVQRAIDEDKGASGPFRERLDDLERFISDLRRIESNGFEFLRSQAIREFPPSTEGRIDLSAMFLRTSTASVGAGVVADCFFPRSSWEIGGNARDPDSWRSYWRRDVTSGYLHVGEIVFRGA